MSGGASRSVSAPAGSSRAPATASFPPFGERFDRLEEQLEILTHVERARLARATSSTAPTTLEPGPALRSRAAAAPAGDRRGYGVARTPALAARVESESNVAFMDVRAPVRASRLAGAACSAEGVTPASWSARIAITSPADGQAALRPSPERIGRTVGDLRANAAAGRRAVAAALRVPRCRRARSTAGHRPGELDHGLIARGVPWG